MNEQERVLAGGGEMGARMRSLDWSQTPLGSVEGWSPGLRTAASVVLNSPQPIGLFWGPEFVLLYNDGFAPIIGSKHPAALGSTARRVFADIWDKFRPLIDGVIEAQTAVYMENEPFFMNRRGFTEEAYFTFSYVPVRDEHGRVAGFYDFVIETTRQVLGERRLELLRELSLLTARAQDRRGVWLAAQEVLTQSGHDVPFALLYPVEDGRARLVVRSGVGEGARVAPGEHGLGDVASPWPLAGVLRSNEERLVESLDGGALPAGPWPESVHRALLLPLSLGGGGEPDAVLVVGLSPRLPLDDGYRDFLQLLARQLAADVARAQALEQQKQRAEQLAALDRAKTAFFSNVSHEFRTPLTLMLGPTENALASPERALRGEELERVHRNELRLLKLVNTLLDFSRLEAGRTRASLEPVDLAELTAGLASAFTSVMEQAGLHLVVDCPPLPQPVWVDKDMWEKIVLNLVSNAFKFTLQGQVAVRLRWRGERVELSVEDTGTGIPLEEQPRLFERFHRVEGARGRSDEGSGIGLSLVRELATLHGGEVAVESEPGRGSTFTVRLPTARAPGSPEPARQEARRVSTATDARAFIQEAHQWLARVPEPRTQAPPEERADEAARESILLVDDNADMREYIERLLRERYRVQAVADGAAALEAVGTHVPELVLSDVMMPGLDGFGLVHALRSSPRTALVPILLLSARAGEEARVEGLEAGADDYLVKPFSARELFARVESSLRRARERNERARQAQERADFEQYLIGIVSHDLRNPLAAITLSASALLRQKELGERLLRPVERIASSAARAQRMIHDLLDFTRARLGGSLPVHRRALDLHALVRQVVEELRAASPERELSLEQSGDGQVVWDGDRVAQVLTNLVTNALNYSPPGTPVRVVSRGEAGEGLLEVHNEGPPIAADVLPQLFQPLRRGVEGTSASRSVGLGLYIVKNIVEAHGGTIQVSSTQQQGTVFTVHLPRRRPEHGTGGEGEPS